MLAAFPTAIEIFVIFELNHANHEGGPKKGGFAKFCTKKMTTSSKQTYIHRKLITVIGYGLIVILSILIIAITIEYGVRNIFSPKNKYFITFKFFTILVMKIMWVK